MQKSIHNLDNKKDCPPKFCEAKLGQAWIVSVDMGYGHRRTAYPLKNLAFEGKIINANSYQGIPEKDRKIWESQRKSYEFISSFKRVPLIGEFSFAVFNEFQKIHSFYPKRDLSRPSIQLKYTHSLIKKGWGKHLIEKLKDRSHWPDKNPPPMINTFFIPAFMAEFFNYPGEIFCVVCDADISRAWAPLNPLASKIKYFAPTPRVVERLKLYGVKQNNIFLTGYPLPQEIIGTDELEVLKHDLRYRLLNLDSRRKYFRQYKALIREYLGDFPEKSNLPRVKTKFLARGHPLTLMFTVGGAGAQKEIGSRILKSLAKKIKVGEVRLILVAGIREKVKDYFAKNIKKLGLEDYLGASIDRAHNELGALIEILFAKDMESYFQNFNQTLRTTDILWTKPSELSFYTALGLPIIIAPPIGYQENFNQEWLLKLGSGLVQKNPDYTGEWLFDWLDSGLLAEAAMQGFVEGEKLGTLNIKKILNPKS